MIFAEANTPHQIILEKPIDYGFTTPDQQQTPETPSTPEQAFNTAMEALHKGAPIIKTLKALAATFPDKNFGIKIDVNSSGGSKSLEVAGKYIDLGGLSDFLSEDATAADVVGHDFTVSTDLGPVKVKIESVTVSLKKNGGVVDTESFTTANVSSGGQGGSAETAPAAEASGIRFLEAGKSYTERELPENQVFTVPMFAGEEFKMVKRDDGKMDIQVKSVGATEWTPISSTQRLTLLLSYQGNGYSLRVSSGESTSATTSKPNGSELTPTAVTEYNISGNQVEIPIVKGQGMAEETGLFKIAGQEGIFKARISGTTVQIVEVNKGAERILGQAEINKLRIAITRAINRPEGKAVQISGTAG